MIYKRTGEQFTGDEMYNAVKTLRSCTAGKCYWDVEHVGNIINCYPRCYKSYKYDISLYMLIEDEFDSKYETVRVVNIFKGAKKLK